MKLNVYAVRDEVAKIFKFDFKRSRHGEAVRFFGDGVKGAGSELSEHPSDFNLYFLATFDSETGRFENVSPAPERLASAIDFISHVPASNNGGV